MTNFSDTFTAQIQTAATAVNDANSRILDAVVDVNRTAVDFAVKSADRIPAVELPVDMPSAADTGERYLDFVERAVSLNRELNARVIDMLPTDVKPSKKTATKPAAKTATKKAAAKK